MDMMRESIFAGTLRTFCKSFSAVVGLFIGIVVVGIGLMALSGSNYLPPHADPLIMPDANGERALLPGNTAVVLRIDIHGVIGMGDLTAETIENLLINSQEGFLRGNRVKAILLHMDTPGGTVDAADAIYRSLLRYKAKYKVPIYGYVEGLCASGGMYVAAAADKILASPSSVIGSIGVIMGPTFNFSDALSKVGISSLTLTEGKDKDALNPFRPWKPAEEASLQAILSSLYQRFVSIVSSARPQLSKEALINQYGANVFIAAQAKDFGYIDEANADYSTALNQLTEQAGISPSDSYQVVQLIPPHPLIPSLIQSIHDSHTVTHSFDLPPIYSSELSGKPLYLYTH